ncbi:ABC transporter ATP-binding protein [Glaciibacter psychrotolerans]|uniref:Branched-chain amino acid transport system ATP-binding protein n=1 Tax=Glaciibacter psychrotolerans TaxID=670054 RepID=A0A7Z0EF53_9MICO|nr:ABC transporter ATP-binding protein [Leifsonia psychrotolerans]NYJ20523.1 branched-chain amino acid transport system ATP-binding protein [Leifsonia psychrotolerans]
MTEPHSAGDPTPTVLLDVVDLHAGYGLTEVLRGINLRVAEGEFSVVIGPNGHGKSTLLRAISGLVAPRSGSIRFAGSRIDTMRTETIVGQGLIHIPQGDMLFPDMTVSENLALGAFVKSAQKNRAAKLERVYDIFPRLAERATQRARTLSGGERRMLAIGRGLMGDARMLMIDEPSLGLAPVLVEEVYRQIARIAAEGMTVLLVEEDFSRVRDVADHVTLVENGSVVLSGSVDYVLSHPAIAATYLGIDT